jgi:hypothetical protein
MSSSVPGMEFVLVSIHKLWLLNGSSAPPGACPGSPPPGADPFYRLPCSTSFLLLMSPDSLRLFPLGSVSCQLTVHTICLPEWADLWTSDTMSWIVFWTYFKITSGGTFARPSSSNLLTWLALAMGDYSWWCLSHVQTFNLINPAQEDTDSPWNLFTLSVLLGGISGCLPSFWFQAPQSVSCYLSFLSTV